MTNRKLFCQTLAAAVLIYGAIAGSASALADTLVLGASIRVDGNVVRTIDSSDRPAVIIEVDSELQLAIPQQRIRRTTKADDEKLVWYREQVAAAGNDPEAHYQLARQCKANGLIAQRDYHFNRAIEIDPNHSKARSAMGYVREGSDWIFFSEQQRKRGLIQTAAGWRVPEVQARDDRMEEMDDAAKIWKRDIAKLRSTILGRSKRKDEAYESLRKIEDPLASAAFAEMLEKYSGNDADPLELRMLYLKKLESFKTPIATQTFVRLGLYERDSNVRRACLEALQKHGASSAVGSYLQILKNPKHKPDDVTKALRALNYFPDSELWETYIDALITEHKFLSAPKPGMTVGNSNTGGGGLSTGGKQEVIIRPQQNSAALELLRTIAPGVDYRYDKASWRKHFADQLLGSSSDLRRDP